MIEHRNPAINTEARTFNVTRRCKRGKRTGDIVEWNLFGRRTTVAAVGKYDDIRKVSGG